MAKELPTSYKLGETPDEVHIDDVQENKNTMHRTPSISIIPTMAPFHLPLLLDRLIYNYQNIILYIY